MPETYAAVRSVLTGSLRVPDDAIHPQATLEQLGLDSMALTEMVLILHERFAVKIGSEYAALGRTVTEVADHIDTLLAVGSRTETSS